jgi:hypothetical protein
VSSSASLSASLPTLFHVALMVLVLMGGESCHSLVAVMGVVSPAGSNHGG